jgi:hypothetical protein
MAKFRVHFTDQFNERRSVVVDADNPEKAGSVVRKEYEKAIVNKIKKVGANG